MTLSICVAYGFETKMSPRECGAILISQRGTRMRTKSGEWRVSRGRYVKGEIKQACGSARVSPLNPHGLFVTSVEFIIDHNIPSFPKNFSCHSLIPFQKYTTPRSSVVLLQSPFTNGPFSPSLSADPLGLCMFQKSPQYSFFEI